MVGDAQIGKTSLMVKYVEGAFDEDYIQTLGTSLFDTTLYSRLYADEWIGVNFMEKTISIRNTEITFSIWDLGGNLLRRSNQRSGLHSDFHFKYRTTRVYQHVTFGMQRRCGTSVYV